MIKNYGGWYWFISDIIKIPEASKSGKWMYFFADQKYAKKMCKKAIEENICIICKCTNMEETGFPTGVVCFYCDYDDIEAHKRILKFMIDEDLIRKTKKGNLYNISYKFDEQTRNGEYGDNFQGELKLSHFVDLKTGNFII